jgi:hypothetical protein
MKFKITIILLLIMLVCNLNAISDKAGTSGFAFLKINYSARAMGMGNAFTGLANDGDAVFFNPAGILQNKTKHIKTTYMSYIDGLYGGSIVYSTEYKNGWHIAPFVQFLVSESIPRTFELNGNYGGVDGSFNTSNVVFGLALATEIHEVLDAGFNVKYLSDKLDSYSASAIALDLSLLHQTNNPNLKIGASLKNIGKQLSYYTQAKYKEKLPLTMTVGASYKYLDKGFINLDICRPFDNDFFGRLGLEYYYNKYFTLRTGLDSRMNDYRTDESLDFMSGISFGAGFNWNQYTLDYAASSFGSLGFVNQISISYNF